MSSKSMLRAPGSLTSGEIEPVRFIGPMAPATQRGRSGRPLGRRVARLARQPGGGEVELVREVLHAVVGERNALRVERVGLDDVGAGLEILVVDRADDVRPGEHQQVVVALQVAGPVSESLAAEVLLGKPVLLDHRPHRPVDDQDPLAQRGGQVLGGVGTEGRAGSRPTRVPRGRQAGRRAATIAATREVYGGERASRLTNASSLGWSHGGAGRDRTAGRSCVRPSSSLRSRAGTTRATPRRAPSSTSNWSGTPSR